MESTIVLPRARRDNLVIQELDDETLIYDLERDEAHCLNKTAALVWGRCDGKTTDGRMARLLEKQFRTPIDVDLVWLAVQQLQHFHLIEGGEGSTAATRSVTRRKLLLKYAPAALALPVIMSISAPTPAQGQTCAGLNQSCANFPCCPNPPNMTCTTGFCRQIL